MEVQPWQGTGSRSTIFAYPLPAIAIAELLGVPPEDRDRFKRWADDLTVFMEGVGSAQNGMDMRMRTPMFGPRLLFPRMPCSSRFKGLVSGLRG